MKKSVQNRSSCLPSFIPFRKWIAWEQCNNLSESFSCTWWWCTFAHVLFTGDLIVHCMHTWLVGITNKIKQHGVIWILLVT